MPEPRTFWCASCRRTALTTEEAAACSCGTPIAARRGEYVVSPHAHERAQRSTCSCGDLLFFIPTDSGASVPIAHAKVRRVPCPFCSSASSCSPCASRRELILGLSHFLECPDAEKHRAARAAKRAPRPSRSSGDPTADRAKVRPLAPIFAQAQILLRHLRAAQEPQTSTELAASAGQPADVVQRGLAHLRAAGLARPVPRNAGEGEARNAWETTPRGDREDLSPAQKKDLAT